MSETTPPASSPSEVRIDPRSVKASAKAGSYFRNTRYIVTLGLLVMGVYCVYDGFWGMPGANQKFAEMKAQGKVPPREPHDDWSILLNRALGFVLPPMGVFLFVRWMRKSRGEFRMENGVLYAPGHPPVDLDDMIELDESKWKRKGVATVKYEGGEIKLDDFVYQQEGIDAIFKAIQTSFKDAEDEAEGAESAGR